MRRIRYAVAASLDGYIAGPEGEADWIIMNPEIDFRAVFEQFDTFLVGRRTFETMARAGRGETPGMKTFVFSRTLRQQDYPGVTVERKAGTFVTPDPNGTAAQTSIVTLFKTETINPTGQTYFLAYDIATGATSNNSEGVTIVRCTRTGSPMPLSVTAVFVPTPRKPPISSIVV